MNGLGRQRAKAQHAAIELGAQQLSNRQYTLFVECVNKGGITLRRMLEISQTTAGSLVRREFFYWDGESDRFQLTGKGEKLMEMFGESEIGRKNFARPLSTFIRDGRVMRKAQRAIADLKERAAASGGSDAQAEQVNHQKENE